MGGGKKTNPFRSSYERLSEFCHPNTLGLTIASDIIKSGGAKTVVYYKVPEFRKEDFGTFGHSCDSGQSFLVDSGRLFRANPDT
jgi:hypothetical protein